MPESNRGAKRGLRTRNRATRWQTLMAPDILWIVTTQWRAQACGYAGDPNARTPCLDALAARSVNYTQAVTPHPFGPFARAAMLTGVPSPQNGLRVYFDPLPTGARTIAHDLGARGYATAFFGKWHLAAREPGAALVGEVHAKMIVPPEARGGFGFWEGFESGFLLNDPWLHGSRLEIPRKFEGYQSDVVCERASAWLSQRSATSEGGRSPGIQPWFCVVSLEPPHPPYAAPAAGISTRDPRELVLPPNVPLGGEVETQARRELAGYYAHIEATDRAIGRLVDRVDFTAARGRRLPPAVVFTSVHGDMHGAHALFRKGWPHEESVRVPLLVRPPQPYPATLGERPWAGESNPAAISLVDLPHLTRAWAAERTAIIEQSCSLISMPSVVALPLQCDRAWRGARTRSRKAVFAIEVSAGSGHLELPWLFFDLQNDPWETRNVAGEKRYAGEIEEFRAAIDSRQM